MIFIINRGYIFKEFFTYNAITDVLITTKLIVVNDYPVIVIKTLNNTYEILFTKIVPYGNKIKGIVDCITNRNPNIHVKKDSKYYDADDTVSFIKDSLFTKIKLK